MTLSASSIEWAIQSVSDHSDGDLFPRIAEMEAIVGCKTELAEAIADKALASFKPGPHRRFIVPKDEISYRQATQLDPQDNIILTATMYQYGQGIEDRRRPNHQVFSYRFAPTISDGLYGPNRWNEFWRAAAKKAASCEAILYCDISDFYNQIAHHTVDNQLIASSFPNQAIKWIIALLESTTAGVSRGIPVGPHAAHLLAEASMIPIDNSLDVSGLVFMRYADDIVIFCQSERDARRSLSQLAQTLDKQQRLTLQKHKTKFYEPRQFRSYAAKMIEDRPINEEEARLLGVVQKYTGGSRYTTISYNQIDDDDWSQFSPEVLRSIIEEYISAETVDYIRLRWFYRRLAQVGHPGAVEVTLDRIEQLEPCFASICSYFASLQSIETSEWETIGSRLIELLQKDEIKESEYFKLSILSLFSRNSKIDHFGALRNSYASSDAFAKREIFLAAKQSGAVDWVREFKEDVATMEHWQKLAFIFCCSDLPADERKYLINSLTLERPFDSALGKWSKKK